MRYTVIVFLLAVTAISASAAELIRNGQALAEIIISKQADPSVKTAAAELRKHLRQMSGAELAIVTEPTGKTPVYVGRSVYTDKLGIKLDDIKYDGFKVIVKDDYVALLGVDSCRPPIPRDNFKPGPTSKAVQKSWEERTGRKWGFPSGIRDPRGVNQELGFGYQDATGSLYAVYEFLEQLGMRWFMPMEELGQVIPERRDIAVAPMELKQEPFFASRRVVLGNVGARAHDTLWLKYLRQGGVFDQFGSHTSESVGSYQDHPEYFAQVGGKPLTAGPNHYMPRLASPELRKGLAEYLCVIKEEFPELDALSISQPDGWIALDDRDVAAGWDKREEGDLGRFSDYTWDFFLDVAKQVRTKHPNATFRVPAYGYARKPPKTLDRIPPYFEICFAQSSQVWCPTSPNAEMALREEWFKKYPYLKFSFHDFYLYNTPRKHAPPIPAVFTASMTENFKTLPDNCKSSTIEVPYATNPKAESAFGLPGICHLATYLHGKFTWNKNLDIKATLEDYYDKFFGPARDEMREFYEFSESVWLRPAPRQITAFSGFLKPADVDKYFEILGRARAKAGDSIYGKRIDLIATEMAPLRDLFKELKRTGPYIRAFKAENTTIDGDLSKPIWAGSLAAERIQLRDLNTGVYPEVNQTFAAFRWLPDNSLLIGVTCFERRMGKIRAALPASARDDAAIYHDDDLELFIETPNGYNAKIVVNPNGAVLDHCVTPDMAAVASSWRVEAVAVRKLSDRWTAEIKVKDIGDMPTKSYPWGINLCRARLTGGESEAYAISPTGTGGFLAPTKMGNLYVSGK